MRSGKWSSARTELSARPGPQRAEVIARRSSGGYGGRPLPRAHSSLPAVCAWSQTPLLDHFQSCVLAIAEAQTEGVDLQKQRPDAVPTRDGWVHHSPAPDKTSELALPSVGPCDLSSGPQRSSERAVRGRGIASPMTDQRVLLSIENHIAHVRLNRPAKRNGLDLAMFEGIIATGEAILANPSVRAVVLSGEGPAFCAGLDVKAFFSMSDGGQRLLERPATLICRTKTERRVVK